LIIEFIDENVTTPSIIFTIYKGEGKMCGSMRIEGERERESELAGSLGIGEWRRAVEESLLIELSEILKFEFVRTRISQTNTTHSQ
jgi:hypothetical protein